MRQPEEIDDPFSRDLGRVDAVLVTDDAFLDTHRPRIGMAAIRARLVSVCGYPVPGDRQCLRWYGPDLLAVLRRSAHLVDRILKGANPADLPVEQPTTFRLAINLKTAKAIGLTFPESILLRADEVVE